MQARAQAGASNEAYALFDHVSEQEALFSRITSRRSDAHGGSAPPSAGDAWHTITGRKKGLLCDTGAVKPFTGGAFVRSQVAGMEAQGFQAYWTKLAMPEHMRGAGRGSQTCTYKVDLVGALRTGESICYSAPVLDSGPSDTSGDTVPP